MRISARRRPRDRSRRLAVPSPTGALLQALPDLSLRIAPFGRRGEAGLPQPEQWNLRPLPADVTVGPFHPRSSPVLTCLRSPGVGGAVRRRSATNAGDARTQPEPKDRCHRGVGRASVVCRLVRVLAWRARSIRVGCVRPSQRGHLSSCTRGRSDLIGGFLPMARPRDGVGRRGHVLAANATKEGRTQGLTRGESCPRSRPGDQPALGAIPAPTCCLLVKAGRRK